MGSFTAKARAARFMYYADRNSDNLLIGPSIGPGALVIYLIAYSLGALWLRSLRLTAAIIFPAMAGVIVAAPDAVAVILGNRWAQAAVVIQIFAWVAMIQSSAI